MTRITALPDGAPYSAPINNATGLAMNRYTIEGTNRNGYEVRRIVRATTAQRALDRATADGLDVSSVVLVSDRLEDQRRARDAWASVTRGADGL